MMRFREEPSFTALTSRHVLPDEFELGDRPVAEPRAAAIDDFVRFHVNRYAARLLESRSLQRAG